MRNGPETRGGAALFVDYGHLAPRSGSTLQAVMAHEKVGVFDKPGEMDLTAHVDFAALADAGKTAGVRMLGTATQGEWLTALGIDARAAALSKGAPERGEEIEAATREGPATSDLGALPSLLRLTLHAWWAADTCSTAC